MTGAASPTDHADGAHLDGADYRFDTFRTSLLLDDMRFRRRDPGPGDHVPHFELPTLSGGIFTSRSLGPRPVLMIFGSQTCPVTQSALPRLQNLHDEFGDRVRFVFVNTREAHPGDTIRQPMTSEQKRAHAEALRDQHHIDYDVAIDDIEGTLHRHFSPKPNSAYLLRNDGTIVYRAHWANDDVAVRKAIEGLLQNQPARGKSRAMIGPLMRAVGHLPAIVRTGGPKIERDVWRAAPPLAVLARVSTWLRPLRVDWRGPVAAIGLTALVLGGVAAAIMI